MDTIPSQSSTDLIIENKRYREALERIVWQNGLSALQRIAREALGTHKSAQDPILDHFDDPNTTYRDDPYYKLTDAQRKSVEQYFRERGHGV